MRSFGMSCLIRPRKRWIHTPRLERHVTIKLRKLEISGSMAAINTVLGLLHPVMSWLIMWKGIMFTKLILF